jgi:hypothetical protein
LETTTSVSSSSVRIAAVVAASPDSANTLSPRALPAAYASTTSRPVTNRMMSKSCTLQSRKMPPDTSMYPAGGGAGSIVVDRIVCSQPTSPLSTAARAATNPESKRRL